MQYGNWYLYELNARHKLETKKANKTLDKLYQAENNKIMQRILKAIINKTISKDKKNKSTTNTKNKNTAQQPAKLLIRNKAKGLETTFKSSETLKRDLKPTINNTMDTDFLSNEVFPQ